MSRYGPRRMLTRRKGAAMGPVEYLVISFTGGQFTGEIMPRLNEVRDRRIIRLLDLLFVAKDANGTVTMQELSDLSDEESDAIGLLDDPDSGWFSADDIEAIADDLEPE